MTGFSSVAPTVLRSFAGAIENKSWTWNEIFYGHLAGNKLGTFSKIHHQVDVFKWVYTTFDSYRLYNQAHSVGFFNNYPRLINPVKYVAIVVAVMNLYKVVKAAMMNIMVASVLNNVWKPSITDNLVWNLTYKIHAVSSIALMIYGFQEHPMQAAAFFASGAITLADRGARLLSEKASFLWKLSTWLPRGYMISHSNWVERCVLLLKLGMKGYKKFT